MKQIFDFKEIKDVNDLKVLFTMFVRNENIYVCLNNDYCIDKIVVYDNTLPRIH